MTVGLSFTLETGARSTSDGFTWSHARACGRQNRDISLTNAVFRNRHLGSRSNISMKTSLQRALPSAGPVADGFICARVASSQSAPDRRVWEVTITAL